MDIGTAPRTVDVSAIASAPARSISPASTSPIKTQLPAPKAVRAVENTQRTSVETNSPTTPANINAAEEGAKKEARSFSFDNRTNEVIFQVLNTNTGEILRQYPEESALRLRALYKEAAQKLEEKKSPESITQGAAS
jgi:uncharacterized FlaG/YvyC family protein